MDSAAGAGEMDPTTVRAETVAIMARETLRRIGETPQVLDLNNLPVLAFVKRRTVEIEVRISLEQVHAHGLIRRHVSGNKQAHHGEPAGRAEGALGP